MVSIVHHVEIFNNLVDRFILPDALKQDPNGLTPSQYKILYYLYTHINVHPRDLAHALNITSPAAAYALQRLSRDGFVEMASSTEDKRDTADFWINQNNKLVCIYIRYITDRLKDN
ncbi:MAG: MarR family transcriptional regulator [Firmicutes bacterium]|nr:MarR family transcriptional regulator [Bacillota bacterium]